jgi:hypothetical protein
MVLNTKTFRQKDFLGCNPILMSFLTTGVKDTSGKFTAGVIALNKNLMENVIMQASLNTLRINLQLVPKSPVPEFIDPVLGFKTLIFMKTSTKCSFSFQSLLRDAGIC